MKIIIICDSFKGTISSRDANRLVAKTLTRINEHLNIQTIPFSDGGEGFLECLLENFPSWEPCKETVFDSNRKEKEVPYLLHDNTAYLEVASIIGLKDVEGHSTPMKATSYGLGQLLHRCIRKGIRHFVIGLGGSATDDMGAGMLAALGFRFFHRQEEVYPFPDRLQEITTIQPPLVWHNDLDFTLYSDVTSPLLGEKGATYTFALQKGAREEDLPILERGIENMHSRLEELYHILTKDKIGAGAAGGLGAIFHYLGKTRVISGAEGILDLCQFQKQLLDCDCVITGEGKLDSTSMQGKAISHIAKACKKNNVPFYILCGIKEEGMEEFFLDYPLLGITAMYQEKQDLDFLKSHVQEDLEKATKNAADILLKNTKPTRM